MQPRSRSAARRAADDLPAVEPDAGTAPAPGRRVRFERGTPAADLHLDARAAPGTVFTSHAHGDHLAHAGDVVCTPETSALQVARRCRPATVQIPLGETRRVGPAELTLRSASHALGSAMLTARTPDGVVAYTGDYKLRPNPLTPPAEVPRCDVLVMECTFGEPRYRFPPDAQTIARLLDFVRDALADGAVPVVLGYPLGKGQEALWHLMAAGHEVALHGSVANMTDVHERLGVAFPTTGRWVRYVRGELEGRVLLTTPSSRKSPMVERLPRKRVVHLTGWALHPGAHNMYRDCDLVLPLSDHADFDELVRTARESGASKVYTVHGASRFAAHLRSLGLDAEHLAEHPQSTVAAEPDETPPDQLDLLR